ncbi:MerR family DNA-binding transcriptional regulator [Pseudonocardia xinjiangensis]|uniref:MerR family DNA-binding transcriptional regulator n=1 Tax=Pseudonocardia xinjiangensis TaxID=75289 RepID=UPI003D8E42E0
MARDAGEKLLTTGKLAEALSVSATAVLNWQRSGLITPAWTTPGGHARWRLEDVENQLRAARKRDE